MNGEPLRIGVLGAARITALSLIEPTRATGHRVVAVAARDRQRAEEFATANGIERVLDSYAAVLADPEVEVVYNPLPNAWHGFWNIAAARAGKHVLAEKPSAANADEARQVAAAVEAGGGVFMEAFHYPYHPLFRRIRALIEDGTIGEVQHVEALLCMPAPDESDPRWSRALAGGSTMDLGCYALSCARLLGPYAGGEPRVVDARGVERTGKPGVDASLFVDLEFPSGATGLVGSDMANEDGRDFHLTVRGTRGSLHAPMFAVPSEDDALVVQVGEEPERTERLGRRSSYTYQLEAFAAAVREGAPVLTDPAWSVANMELIDTAYGRAGFPLREPAT